MNSFATRWRAGLSIAFAVANAGECVSRTIRAVKRLWRAFEVRRWRRINVLCLLLTGHALNGQPEYENYSMTSFVGGTQGGADGVGAAAQFYLPRAIVSDSKGNLFVADGLNRTIRKITSSGEVSTFAGLAGALAVGPATYKDGYGPDVRFFSMHSLGIDRSDTLYIGDGPYLRKATPERTVVTLDVSYTNRPGHRHQSFSALTGLVVDEANNIYVADRDDCAIRMISPDGSIAVLAGLYHPIFNKSGFRGASDGRGQEAHFNGPNGIVRDAAGNLYIADTENHTIRKLSPDGIVITYVGKAGSRGSADGVGGEARFDTPTGLAIDRVGNLFVTDSGNRTIRKVRPDRSTVTLAGAPGVEGDSEGLGAAAQFGYLVGLTCTDAGILYVTDSTNNRILRGEPTKKEPDVWWNAPRAIGQGRALTRRELNAVANVSGTFMYSPAAGTILDPGKHTLTCTFIPADTATYAVAGRSVDIEVTEASVGARLIALAARAAAGSGDQTLIMGFVVDGNKEVLVQGVGPGIAASVPTALADPRLELFRLQGGTFAKVDENNDWVNSSAITETRAQLGASAMAVGSKDAALLKTLTGGVYTAHVASGGAAGVALVEAYDASGGGSSRLMALSTRTVAGAGDATLIAGFVLEGNGPKTVLIRGLGPELALRGVQGVLADPRITVYRGSDVVGSNDDWGGSQELKDEFAAIGAEQLASNTSKDAALLVTLNPGAYTVHVTGAAGTTGVALVEIFDVP